MILSLKWKYIKMTLSVHKRFIKLLRRILPLGHPIHLCVAIVNNFVCVKCSGILVQKRVCSRIKDAQGLLDHNQVSHQSLGRRHLPKQLSRGK